MSGRAKLVLDEPMTECKHEWEAIGEHSCICKVCGLVRMPEPLTINDVREIVREEIAKAAQPCRHEKWIEMDNGGDVCRSCGAKR